MKILVTGATGFLGTALCKRLEKDGHEVVKVSTKNCDLTKADSLLKFNDKKYDQIFHLAAWTQAGDFCLTHAGEQWIINQQINTNVLIWWKEHQPQAKLICMGTSCSYDPNLALSEENYMVGKPIDSLFTYAMTKRMLYAGLLALTKQFGLKYLYFVPSTLYGPDYHRDGRQLHFIFDLIRKIVDGKQQGKEVVLWGDGNQKRELVFIDDFVDVMLDINSRYENDLINIGAGEEFAIKRFARLICDKVDYDFKKIKFDVSKYVGAKSKCLDIKKLKELVPGLKFTSLKEGLDKTIKWYLDAIKK
jgi:GDP-L-fucose synthase